MRQRDKAILDDLAKFRCLSRNQIATLHFAGNKDRITAANLVLKRLRRDGLVEADTTRRPFVYFPAGSGLRKAGQKVEHFLSIVDFYLELRHHGQLTTFEVEPKLGGKGTVEPDVFCIWRAAPFFVEVQRSVYSAKTMQAKLDRYEAYFRSGEWRRLAWQPRDKEIFPFVWLISEQVYEVGKRPFRVFQSRGVIDFLGMVGQRRA